MPVGTLYTIDASSDFTDIFTDASVGTDGGNWRYDIGGTSASSGTGPGTNNTLTFMHTETSGTQSLMVIQDTGLTTMDAAFIPDEIGRTLRFRLCVQGQFGDGTEGLVIEQRADDSASWAEALFVHGWAYSNNYNANDTVSDENGVVRTFAADGGWIDYDADIPDTANQIRLRPVYIDGPGNTYAHDIAIRELQWSWPDPVVIPDAPTNLIAAASGADAIDLSWDDPSNATITGYRIERRVDNTGTYTTLVNNTANTDLTYSDATVAAATTYQYRIYAINTAGTSSASNTASATTDTASTPVVPTPAPVDTVVSMEPETTIENIDHLEFILASNYIGIQPYLTHYEKDGVTLREPFDLTPFMEVQGSYVARNSSNAVPSRFSCKLSIELKWTEIILEPSIGIYDKLSGDLSIWRLGQYFIETPVTTLMNPNEFQITAYDNISMYNTDVIHSYEVDEGQNIVADMQEGILGNNVDWGNVQPRFRFQPTADTAPNDRVWEINESHTFLTIANDLLDTVGFRQLFSDRDGAFVTEHLVNLRDKTPVFTIDAEADLSVVSLSTKYKQDTWKVPNVWLGISGNVNRDSAPSFTDGLYIIRNTNIGSTSLNARGRPVNKIVTVDAANQLALISVVEFEAEKDFSAIEQVHMQCVPMPFFWHETVVNLRIKDFNIFDKKMVARSWQIPFDGSDMTVEFDVLNLLPQ